MHVPAPQSTSTIHPVSSLAAHNSRLLACRRRRSPSCEQRWRRRSPASAASSLSSEHPNPSHPASASNSVSSPAASADPHPASRGGAWRPPASAASSLAGPLPLKSKKIKGEGGGVNMEEWSLPPSPSLVVRSPRQTLSLLRNRHPGREFRSRPTATSTSVAGGPKPSEVYGFVGSITTVIATTVYLVWAYMPEHCLRSLGITYYPSRYWALAVPSFVIVATALCMVIYMGFNFLATPPPASLNTFFDEYSRERTVFDPANANATEEEEP